MSLEMHSHTFEVYVPVARAIPAFKKRVLDVAGGLTIQHSIGLWKDAQGNVFEEPVYIYRWSCASGDRRFDDCSDAQTDLVYALLDAGEQAVYYTLGGVPFIRSKA